MIAGVVSLHAEALRTRASGLEERLTRALAGGGSVWSLVYESRRVLPLRGGQHGNS